MKLLISIDLDQFKGRFDRDQVIHRLLRELSDEVLQGLLDSGERKQTISTFIASGTSTSTPYSGEYYSTLEFVR